MLLWMQRAPPAHLRRAGLSRWRRVALRPARPALAGLLAAAALILALVLLPLVLSSLWLRILTSAAIYALAAAGTALLYARLGLVSLCQFALVGVGGWVTLRIGHAFHPPFEVSMLAGGLVAAFIGLIFGIPALRLRGLYLALVTLMLAGAFQIVISAWGFPDGGPGFLGRADGSGRSMLPRPALADEAAISSTPRLVATLGLILVRPTRSPPRASLGAHPQGRNGGDFQRRQRPDLQGLGIRALRLSSRNYRRAAGGNVGQLEGRAFSASRASFSPWRPSGVSITGTAP